MAKGETYEEFVEKFKPKKTTDDCYTPPLVYDAVAKWTAQEYSLDREDFVRPFYPGGDYEHFDYSCGKIVVDNPPFSILNQIVRFYVDRGIRFLLFTPTLVSLIRLSDLCTVFPTGVSVKYENGAVVNTSFCTNLDPKDIRMRTVPALYVAVSAANATAQKEKRGGTAEIHLPAGIGDCCCDLSLRAEWHRVRDSTCRERANIYARCTAPDRKICFWRRTAYFKKAYGGT